jgi:protein O-mannosyl-transferase
LNLDGVEANIGIMKRQKKRQSGKQAGSQALLSPNVSNVGQSDATGIKQLLAFLPRHGWIFGLFLVAATILAYQPVWHAGFIWDDDQYVTNDLLLMVPDGLKRIWFSTDAPSQYFPLTYTVFRWEHMLWGFNSTGYHWVNILLHAVNALLVWRLLKRLNTPGAMLAAAVFALHPVQVESVAWITECKNVLMCFFFLLSLFCWVEFVEASASQRWLYYCFALVLYALALFSKTTACTLPAALLLVLWLKREPIRWNRLVEIIPFLAMGLGMGLLTVWWERFHQGTQGKLFSLGLTERILVASHAVWFYLGKMLWPVNLMFSYPKWTINPTSPLAYGWLAAGVALCPVIYFVRRFVGRSVEVAALLFVAILSPTLGFIMLSTFRFTYVADHYQYVASISLISLAAAGITVTLRTRPYLKSAICGALLLTLGVLTWRQCRMYADSETLWRTTIDRNHSSWMAQNNLGDVLLSNGRLDEAMAHFKAAIAMKPDYDEAYNDLGYALFLNGQTDAAIVELQRALAIRPDFAEAHNNLGDVLIHIGQTDAAIVEFQRALATRPDFTMAHYNLGNALLQKGQNDGAILQYQGALGLSPDFAQAHMNLGIALVRKGRLDEAINQFQETVRLKPDDAEAQSNLARALELESKSNVRQDINPVPLK